MTEGKSTWRFPVPFWTANAAELCERAAYYGTFVVLVVYLTRVVGLSDAHAGFIGALFAAFIYLFPFVTGAIADRIGFRNGLMLAFALLTVGYGTLGYTSSYWPVLLGLFLIVVGGSFVKPIISGTVSKSSDSFNRARAFSLFYMVVNIGSFTGKTIVKDIRQDLGVGTVPYFSAVASLVALVLVALIYWPDKRGAAAPRSALETIKGMGIALSNMRFLALILITAGFWAIQGQLYASMPKYVLRLVGEHAAPEWYANVNPLVVVIFVVPITQLVRKVPSEISIAIAMALIPLSSLSMALSHYFDAPVELIGFAVHPITMMMVIGIAIQGLSECFLSPKYLEFASKQAPEGQEGLYLGYSHMNVFFAWLFGFIFAGFMLERYVPEPETLPEAVQAQRLAALAGEAPMPEVYAQAHYLWYSFAIVGVVSFIALLIYIAVTRRLDRRAEVAD
jgi:dipeptide/tripeptide permease